MTFPFPMTAPFGKPLLLTEAAFTLNNNGEGVTTPAGIQAGDIAIYGNRASATFSAPADTTPSGYTQIGTYVEGWNRISLSYRILVGSEGGAGVSGFGGISGLGGMLVLRPSKPVSTITTYFVGADVGNDNSPSFTAALSGRLTPGALVGFLGASNVNDAGQGSLVFNPSEDSVPKGSGIYSHKCVRMRYQTYVPGASPVNKSVYPSGWFGEGSGNAGVHIAAAYLELS